MIIELINKSDLEKVKILLLENELPIDDIEDSLIQLFVAKIGNNIVGVIGLEQYKTIGLLRSLAVKSEYKNQKYGRDLTGYFLEYCKDNKIQELYLLTTTAEKYFRKFDFYKINRENVPTMIKRTKQFSDICPVTAVIMKKDLSV